MTTQLSRIAFTSDIARLTEKFTGRQWVFDDIDRWLRESEERFFILTGEPGVGKSAIAAKLIQQRQAQQDLAAYHFCIARQISTIEPDNVLFSLAAQLINFFPDYAEALVNTIKPLHLSVDVEINIGTLKDSVVQGVVIENLHTQHPKKSFDIILRQTLSALPNPPKKPILILIDSLDEAVTYSEEDNLVRLFSQVNDLPSWVRLMFTSRLDERRVLSHFKTLKPYHYHLDELSKKSLEDIHTYVDERVKTASVQGQLQKYKVASTDLVEQLTKLSKGNFLYIKVLLDDIASGGQPLDKENLNKLPKSLGEFYHNFLERRVEAEWEGKYQLIFKILTVTKVPITEDELANLVRSKEFGKTELGQRLKVVQQFLDMTLDEWGKRTYALFHQSLQDYLTDGEASGVFYCAPIDGHQQIVEHYWRYHPTKWDKCDRYGLEYLASHLVDIIVLEDNPIYSEEYTEKLHDVLLTFSWLQAKLDATDVNVLVNDYDFLQQDQALNLVQGAIRLSASTLSQDKTQLASQLLGRLLRFEKPEVQSLLAQAKKYNTKPWLRPSFPSLMSPGQSLISTFVGHQASVRRVVVTPDGRWAISGSNDSTLRIWDLVGKEEVRILKGHSNQVRAIAITPDGKQVVSGSNDRNLKLWDLSSGKEIRTFEGHADIVRAVAVTKDGTRIISASGDGTLKLWDLNSGREIYTLKGHSSRVITVAVTPDGTQIVSGSDDNTIKLWDLDSGIEQFTIACPSRVRSVVITADGNWLISASEGRRIQVWDLNNRHLVKTLDGNQGLVSIVTLTLDGIQVISGSEDGTFKVWDLDSGVEVSNFIGHSEGVNSIAVLPNKQQIISASEDKTLRIWTLSTRNPSYIFDRDNRKITAAVIFPNTHQIALASEDKTLKVWSLHSDKPIRVFKGHTGSIRAVTVLPNGRQIASASEDKTLKIWDMESGELVQTLEGHKGWVRAVAVLPNGQQIISGSDDFTVKLWDLNCGEVIHTFKGRTEPIHAVAVLPDGKRFISASGAGSLHVWDLDKGVLMYTLKGHTDWVRAVAVFPDGETMISASSDKTLRIWNLSDETEIAILSEHTDEVLTVAISSDGQKAVSASQDHTLKLWDLTKRRVIASYSSDYPLCACSVTLGDNNQTVIVAGDEAGGIHLLDLVGL